MESNDKQLKRTQHLNKIVIYPEGLEKSTKKQSKETPLYAQFQNTQKGRRKQSLITAQTLRDVAAANPIARVCIRKIKQKVAKSPFLIRIKDDEARKNPELRKQLKPYMDYVFHLLHKPNDDDDTFRTITSKMLEDALVLDMGVWEKVRNPRGEIVQLYQVDGATIRPNLDDLGQFQKDAYYQYLTQGQAEPDAKFFKDDLCIFMADPKGEAGHVGYGRSPIEDIINTVLTSIQANAYNQSYFDESKLPPAVFNMKGVANDQLIKFKNQWEASMDKGQHQSAFTNAEALTIQLLRGTNQEMQFYELSLWLARIIFGAFELSPQEVGFTQDINKATAEVQQDITEQGGYSTYLDLIAEEINVDIIEDLGNIDARFREIEFAWDIREELDPKTQAEIDQIRITSGIDTPDEIRQRDGKDPLGANAIQKPESNPLLEILSSLEKSEKLNKEMIKFYSGSKDWTQGY